MAFNVASAIEDIIYAISDIANVLKTEISDKHLILSETSNYEIYSQFLSIKEDTKWIMKDLPESDRKIFKLYLANFELKIEKIEIYYKNMVAYHEDYVNHTENSLHEMIVMSRDILQNSADGPVGMWDEIINLFAFGPEINILDKLKEKSQASGNFFLNKI